MLRHMASYQCGHEKSCHVQGQAVFHVHWNLDNLDEISDIRTKFLVKHIVSIHGAHRTSSACCDTRRMLSWWQFDCLMKLLLVRPANPSSRRYPHQLMGSCPPRYYSYWLSVALRVRNRDGIGNPRVLQDWAMMIKEGATSTENVPSKRGSRTRHYYAPIIPCQKAEISKPEGLATG